jgi:hypothetical protein
MYLIHDNAQVYLHIGKNHDMKPKFVSVQTRHIKIPGRCELGGFGFLHVSLKTSKPDCAKPGFLLLHAPPIPSPHLDLPLQDLASLSLHPYLWSPSLALFDSTALKS